MTRHPASVSIRILTLIIAALILAGGFPGGVVIRRAAAQAQSNPAGLWVLIYDAQVESDGFDVTNTGITSSHYSQFYQLATESYLNVTTEGKVGSFRTSVGKYVAMSDWSSTLSVSCSVELRDSLVFDVTGSVTGQVVKLSASSPTITPTETQYSGNVAECPTSYGSYLQSFPGIKHLRWVDGYTFSDAPESQTSVTVPCGEFFADCQTVTEESQVTNSVTIGLWQLQSYCNQYTGSQGSPMPPVCVGSGNDDQGPISPPVNIPSPNTVTLSDGSTIRLGGSTLSWNSPGNYTLNCPQTCASDSFSFLRGSWGTIVSVNCPTGPCATITAIHETNFSLSAAANHVTVNDLDGIVQVRALNSSSTVFLSGALGTYSQRVTVDTNENFTTLQKNATTTYATVPRTCNGGTILLNSGQPISGDLNSTQFCVPAGQVTRLQFSVPPSLQNIISLYTATSNSSAIAMLASGENKTGTTASGIMALSGIPTEMPIPLISPSGNDPVSIAVNNTGSANAVVTFQLQFSSPTGGGGIPELSYLLVAAIVFAVLVVASYLVIRNRKPPSRR